MPPPSPSRTLLLHVCCCCCCYFGCCASRPALYLITEISINKRASRGTEEQQQEAKHGEQRSSDTFCQLTWLSVQCEGKRGGWAEGAWHLAYLRQLNFACAAREGGHDEPRRKPAPRLALNCSPSRSRSHSPFPNAHVSLCLRLRLRLRLNLRSVSKRQKLN